MLDLNTWSELLKKEFALHPEMRIEDVDVDRVDYEMHREKDSEAIEEAERFGV